MVTAGVYLVARSYPCLPAGPSFALHGWPPCRGGIGTRVWRAAGTGEQRHQTSWVYSTMSQDSLHVRCRCSRIFGLACSIWVGTRFFKARF